MIEAEITTCRWQWSSFGLAVLTSQLQRKINSNVSAFASGSINICAS